MKTIKTLALFLGLSLGIASCSKEGQDSPVLVERQVEGASKHVGSKDSVLVSFTIGADTEELRLAQSLNADGVPVSPFMEEKDVVIRFAVRRNYNGQRYVTYTDAVCKKVAGENKAIYKGGIRLPDIGYDTYPAGSRPSMEGHEIAGVLLGEANNGTKFVEEVDANTVKSIEQTELLTSENDVVRSKIPYILDWMAFPLTSDGVQQQKLTLHFKPVGNLLRLQFNNQFDEAKTLESIKVVSNAFVTQAKFDFTRWVLRQDITNYNGNSPITASGSPMTTLADDYKLEQTYTLATPLRVEARSKSKWHYLWVMPVGYTTWKVESDRVAYNTQFTGRASDGKDYNMLGICSPLAEGSNKLAVSFKIPTTVQTAFKGGKLPLWYVAEYDVAQDGVSLSTTHRMPVDPTTQTSTIQEHEAYVAEISRHFGFFRNSELDNINVPGYFVPTQDDLTVIQSVHSFRSRYNPSFVSLSMDPTLLFSTATPITDIAMTYKEDVLFPGETDLSKVSSTYIVVEEPNPSGGKAKLLAYALRFEQCGQRDKLTAYRYVFNDYDWIVYPNRPDRVRPYPTSPTDANFEVSSVFLGSGFTGDINTISNPAFWAGKSDVVIRKFPILPYIQPSRGRNYGSLEEITYEYVAGQGRASRRIGKNTYWDAYLYELNSYVYPGSVSSGDGRYPVRLIKNEFKTAQ